MFASSSLPVEPNNQQGKQTDPNPRDQYGQLDQFRPSSKRLREFIGNEFRHRRCGPMGMSQIGAHKSE